MPSNRCQGEVGVGLDLVHEGEQGDIDGFPWGPSPPPVRSDVGAPQHEERQDPLVADCVGLESVMMAAEFGVLPQQSDGQNPQGRQHQEHLESLRGRAPCVLG